MPFCGNEYQIQYQICFCVRESQNAAFGKMESMPSRRPCAVQLAARLCSHAQPEQILVSNVVAELCEGKMLPFQELGELNLKEFDQPVRAHAVNWANEAWA
jgi:hypothetical protein